MPVHLLFPNIDDLSILFFLEAFVQFQWLFLLVLHGVTHKGNDVYLVILALPVLQSQRGHSNAHAEGDFALGSIVWSLERMWPVSVVSVVSTSQSLAGVILKSCFVSLSSRGKIRALCWGSDWVRRKSPCRMHY